MVNKPQEKRRGWLKNGNPPGDFSKAPRCGAKNRRGMPCQCPVMENGRCRLHGGLSTGPKTKEGIERIRRAVTKHGRYSQEAMAEIRYFRRLLKECQAVLKKIEDSARDSRCKPSDFHNLSTGEAENKLFRMIEVE
jgi:hypothetical protein